MAHKWHDKVKRTGKLLVYADPTVQTGVWSSMIEASIREFNQLSKQHKLGVTLEASDTAPVPGPGRGADVSVAAASAQITFKYDGIEEKSAFNGSTLHGKTKQVRGERGMEKAYVYLPAEPKISTPDGPRAVGPGVMKLIAVHEFVHACGLVDAEHTDEDLFQGNPTADSGETAARDRIMGKRGKQTVWMPPLFLAPTTVRLIKGNWG